MHASPGLLIASAVVGILLPLGIGAFVVAVDNPVAAFTIRAISFAVVPVLVARVAYRQGYDDARAASRPARPPPLPGK